jgi:NAD(P)-dependent dehydrogenase (short-subunit alcohol dehydrogenase family)
VSNGFEKEETMRLQGKTALVTGATSGIGEAIALAFAREGAQVVITGRNASRGQVVVEKIREDGGSAHLVVADLTSRKGVDHLIAETYKAVGHIDILVNNAGIFPMADTALIDEATFDEVFATNVKAPFYLTAAFAPQMVERGAGKIINITTVLAHKGLSGGSIYGASKAALTLLTRSWAAEFGPGGVNVNAIVPHLVRTPGTEGSIEVLEQIANALPARRYGLPSEIAEAALYLASSAADYVHGVTLPVDGGFLAT